MATKVRDAQEKAASAEATLDQEATVLYTQMLPAVVLLEAKDASTKKIIKAFVGQWNQGSLSAYSLAPPMEHRADDGRGHLFAVLNSEEDTLPLCELSSSDLGNGLRQAFGMDRMGLTQGKYRRAELFGFRVVDPTLGPALIVAVTEKGDRGSGWYVTADPLSSNPRPEWATKGPMSPPPSLGGYGATAFQPWHQLTMQVMAAMGKPIDPRRWFPPENAMVQAWWAARDLLALEQITEPASGVDDTTIIPKKRPRRV